MGRILFVVLALLALAQGLKTETQLQADLLNGYDYNARPVTDASRATNLTVGLAILSLHSFDQLSGEATLNVWLRYKWKDEYLAWNASEYDPKFTTFQTNPEFDGNVWTPDLKLYHSVEVPLADLDYSKVVVYPDGGVTWSRPGAMKATILFKLGTYPFDSQVAHFKLGSWAYDESGIKLVKWGCTDEDPDCAGASDIDSSDFVKNPEWEITKLTTEINYKYYQCCPNPYGAIVFDLHLKRLTGFYAMNLVMPAMTIVLMGVCAFWIPWDGGERASLMATAVLTLTVYLGLLIEHLPFTDEVPWMAKFMCMLWWYSITVLGFGILTINLRIQMQQHNKVPSWLWTLASCCGYALLGSYDLQVQKLEDAVRFASQRKNTKQLEQLHREVSEYRETVAKQYSEEHNIWVRPLPKEVGDGLELLQRLTHLVEISSAGFIDSSMFIEMAELEPDDDFRTPQPSAISDDPEEEDDNEESKDPTDQQSNQTAPAAKPRVRRQGLPYGSIKSVAGQGATLGSGPGVQGVGSGTQGVGSGTGAIQDEVASPLGDNEVLSPRGTTKLRKRNQRRLTHGFDGLGGFSEPHNPDGATEEEKMAVLGQERDKHIFIRTGKFIDYIFIWTSIVLFVMGNLVVWALLMNDLA